MVCGRSRYTLLHRRPRHLLIIALLPVSILSVLLVVDVNEKFSLTSTIAAQTVLLIRTSHRCESRLNHLRQSWVSSPLAQQSNLYLLTDRIAKYTDETVLQSFQNVIESNCSQTHNRADLCCKTAHEFELYYNLTRTNPNLHWMCRFDDDQYVNLDNLYKLLSQFDPSRPSYIGRTSVNYRLKSPTHQRTFVFATYGAGVCFSRPLLQQLRPHVNKTILPQNCVARRLSDDAYIGYLSEVILNVSLTSLNELFHSHLEKLERSFRSFTIGYLRTAVTFGFAWDRYELSWLPVIHELMELIRKGEEGAAKRLWTFLRNYEKEHPTDLKQKRDQSCNTR